MPEEPVEVPLTLDDFSKQYSKERRAERARQHAEAEAKKKERKEKAKGKAINVQLNSSKPMRMSLKSSGRRDESGEDMTTSLPRVLLRNLPPTISVAQLVEFCKSSVNTRPMHVQVKPTVLVCFRTPDQAKAFATAMSSKTCQETGKKVEAKVLGTATLLDA